MEKLVHIIGFPIISKLIRGETVELSDVCFVPDDQLFNESKNKNFCVKFPIPQTSNTRELAATDSQQPQPKTLIGCKNCGNKFGDPCQHPCGKSDYTFWQPIKASGVR